HPEQAKRVDHDARVVGIEQAMDLSFAVGERGEQQHAVRDALRARQPHASGGAARRPQLERFSHFSRAPRASVNSFSSAAASPFASRLRSSASLEENLPISKSSASRFAMPMS